jgi:DNA topoisomerase-3
MEKKLTDKQVERLIEKGSTTNIKGFVQEDQKVEGILKVSPAFKIEFELKIKAKPQNENAMPLCPKCGKGHLIKGKTAYGCSEWKAGCDFRFSFEEIRAKAQGKPLTKELVIKIIGQQS